MKCFIILSLAVAAYSLTIEEHFDSFKKSFNKTYINEYEESYRQSIFEDNYNKIAEHNKEADNGFRSFRLGLNEFADLTSEEFVQRMNGWDHRRHHHHNRHHEDAGVNALPVTVDWRTKGVVTPIKNQLSCGSCWAFSAVASTEGQHALNTGKLVSLSEQNLVDCSTAEGNEGCYGGLMDQAFEYIIKTGGIDTETSYPYEARDDTCRYNKKNSGATISSFVDIPTGDEKSLQNAVATVGPISVAIDASQFSFQFYSSGVYDEPNCGSAIEDLDHGVTAVGYGTDSGKDYWLVKNSWGTSWGIQGYIEMSRNKGNQCGIATASSYPVV